MSTINGFNENSGDSGNEKIWERPWTLDEMRKGSTNWSLASDAGMLQHLQDFSHRLLSKTTEMQEQVNSLVHEVKLTGVRLNNTFSDFITLANTQFVENRVYDEDVTQEDTQTEIEKKEKTKEEREAEIVPRITEALNLGVSVIDTAFEKLDIDKGASDSEDEGYKPAEPLLEPKDPYIHRALPYLIGSPAFLQDDDVGLVDLPSDDEPEAEEPLSESSLSSEEEEEEEIIQTREQPFKGRILDESYDNSDSEGSDLFGDGKKSEEISEEETDEEIEHEREDQPPAQPDFASELAAKLGGVPAAKAPVEEHEDKPEKKSKEKKKKKKDTEKKKGPGRIEDDLFGAPPDEDEDDSPFGRGGGLFSSRGGLFDDVDDGGGGLFDDVIPEKPKSKAKQVAPQPESSSEEESEEEQPPPQPEPKKSSKKAPPGGVSIFGDDNDDLFSTMKKAEAPEETKPPPPKAQTKSAPPVKSGGGGGLFEDDGEDDLFASMAPKASKPAITATPSSKTKASSLFDADSEEEDDGDLFSAPPIGKPAPKSTLSAPPTVKSIAPVQSIMGRAPMMQPTTQGPSESDDEEDLFAEKKEEVKEEVKEVSPKKKLPPGAVSMFGSGPNPLVAALKAKQGRVESDEDDDNWSDDEPTPPASTQVPVKPSPSQSKSSLFENENEDLFGTTSKGPPMTKPVKQQETNKPSPVGSKSSLFLDDDEDDGGGDLFGSSKPKPAPVTGLNKPAVVTEAKKPSPAPSKSSLFADDQDEEEDLFGTSKKTTKTEATPVAKNTSSSKTKRTGAALFDEESEEEDLFGTVSTDPTGGAPKKKDLFSDSKGDDLFGSSAKSDKSSKSSSKQDKKNTSVQVKRRGLFDDVSDDEDLFFNTFPKSKTKQQATVKAPKTQSLFGNDESPPDIKPDRPKSEAWTDQVTVTGITKGESNTEIFTDDDDLFNTTSKSLPEKPKVKAGPSLDDEIKVTGVTKDESNTERFQDVKQEDHATEPKEIQAPVSKPKWKPPAGGVSMFGGMDPSSLLKKKNTTQSTDEGDGLSSSKPIPEETKISTPVFSPPQRTSRGPAPTSEAAVDFDQPAQVDTLQSLGKDRAKIQKKRRPQTRQARQSAMLNTNQDQLDFVVPNPEPTISESTAAPDSAPSSRVPDPSEVLRLPPGGKKVLPPVGQKCLPPGGQQVLFTDDLPDFSDEKVSTDDPLFNIGASKEDNDGDIFSPKSTPVSVENSKKAGAIADDISKSKKEPVVNKPVKQHQPDLKEKAPPLGNESDDDIFSSAKLKPKQEVKTAPPVDDDLFSSKKEQNKPKAKPVVVDDEDDLFSSAKLKPKQEKKTAPPVDDDLDDIFSSAKLTIKKAPKGLIVEDDDIFKSTTPKPTEKPSAPAKTEDTDDIFADVGKTKKTPPTGAKATLEEDDDDIFASASLSKKTKPQKAKTKDEDLFKDDTDIFADIPEAKPKEKKNKKKTTPNQKSLFGDDVDDIFADTNSKPKDKKSSSKKSTTNKPKKDNSDSADIFDDPLSAMK